MSKFVPGDIFELSTPKGLAYIQYTHHDEYNIHVVRVLPGFFDKRPSSFRDLVNTKELYYVGTHLGAGKKGEIRKVGREAVPTHARRFPLMKSNGGRFTATGESDIQKWWLYDGNRYSNEALSLEQLTPEQRKLPTVGVNSPAALAAKLAKGWTPEMDTWPLEKRLPYVKGEPDAISGFEIQKNSDPRPKTTFYLYFADRERAERAGDELTKIGFNVHIHKRPSIEQWSLLASPHDRSIDDPFKLDKELETIASRYGGEYDGSETSV